MRQHAFPQEQGQSPLLDKAFNIVWCDAYRDKYGLLVTGVLKRMQLCQFSCQDGELYKAWDELKEADEWRAMLPQTEVAEQWHSTPKTGLFHLPNNGIERTR